MAKLLDSFTSLNADEDGVSLGSSTTDKITVQNLNYDNNPNLKGLKIGIYSLGQDVYAFASKSNEIWNLNSGNFTSSPDVKLIASGSFETNSEGNAVAIVLNLYSSYTGDVKLHFSNANIDQITGTTKDDEIYIERNTNDNSNGVNSNATLYFSYGGNDTIYFNGATTVQDIWGGKREDTYFSA